MAIETQDKAVIVPMPCEIINAGGTINDKGLIDSKFIFIVWTINRRPIIRIICLEVIIGFSFLEIRIKIPQHTSISKNVTTQDKIISTFSSETISNL